MFFQQAGGVIEFENPVVETSFHRAVAVGFRRGGGRKKSGRAGQQDFARPEDAQFIAQAVLRFVSGEFGGTELAGGKIDKGQADALFGGAGCSSGGGTSSRGHGRSAGNRGEEIVFFSFDQRAGGSGTGSDDTNHF